MRTRRWRLRPTDSLAEMLTGYSATRAPCRNRTTGIVWVPVARRGPRSGDAPSELSDRLAPYELSCVPARSADVAGPAPGPSATIDLRTASRSSAETATLSRS